MSIDARDAAEFYATTLGGLTANLLRRRLAEIWPDCANLSCLGLGYTGPFLRQWREQAVRTIAVSPQNFGNAIFPAGRASLSCTAEEDSLPFPDLSFDRILMVHGLEHADNARQTLREVWRLLKDDGRLIVVVPNRQGMWAYWENSPFGYGQALFQRATCPPALQPVLPGRTPKLGTMRPAHQLAPAAAHLRPMGAPRHHAHPAIRRPHHRRGDQRPARRHPHKTPARAPQGIGGRK